MRTRLNIAAFVTLGLVLGYGIGFGTSVVETESEMSPLSNPYASHDAFTTVFRGLGKLDGAEMVAGFCGKPKNDPLAVEEYAIRAIQDRAAATNLSPPLDVARARLALRRANLAEKNNDLQLKTRYEETAQQLLEKSGWTDPSAAHLRKIVTRLDAEGNTCSPSQAQGGPQK